MGVGSNPFFAAFAEADLIGKLIFLSLIALSVITWTLVVYKYFLTKKIRENSHKFQSIFNTHRHAPLSMDGPANQHADNPFKQIYLVLRRQTLEILNKNRFHKKEQEATYLSPTDIDLVATHLSTTISASVKELEQYLYILSTIVTLAPFLGLLGTVWGILEAFSSMQMHAGGNTNQMVLGGLALALTTTVLGLVDAIPALIGYNYLKNEIRNYQTDMVGFSNDMLASVELQYRQVDVK